jgi:DNA-binding response OmpR family regulator
MARVLLIEPHAESARAYARNLEQAGFSVDRAADPASVVPRANAPSLIVISVPRLDGWLAPFAHLRASPRIALSSVASDARRAEEFDCAAVLIRPVMYDDLVTEVRRVLKMTWAAQRTAPEGAARSTSTRRIEERGILTSAPATSSLIASPSTPATAPRCRAPLVITTTTGVPALSAETSSQSPREYEAAPRVPVLSAEP